MIDPRNPTIEIDGFVLEQTCGACPEQYDVWKGGKQVGYMRLRWGSFRVDLGDCGGETVYQDDVGDGWSGSFRDTEERERQLRMGVHALKTALFKRDLERLDNP